MEKKGIGKLFNQLILADPEEDEDDLFYEDDYEEEAPPRRKSVREKKSTRSYEDEDEDDIEESYTPRKSRTKNAKSSGPGNLVSINSRNNTRSNSQVHVIKPTEFNEAQKVTDYLKNGRPIVINMEGMDVHAAQRIIDFIGGACYALDGSLQAISANMFIAAPHNVDVTGDLREEIMYGGPSSDLSST